MAPLLIGICLWCHLTRCNQEPSRKRTIMTLNQKQRRRDTWERFAATGHRPSHKCKHFRHNWKRQQTPPRKHRHTRCDHRQIYVRSFDPFQITCFDAFASSCSIYPFQTPSLATCPFSKPHLSTSREYQESASLLQHSENSNLPLSSCATPFNYTMQDLCSAHSVQTYSATSSMSAVPRFAYTFGDFVLNDFSISATRAHRTFASSAKLGIHCTSTENSLYFAAKASCSAE